MPDTAAYTDPIIPVCLRPSRLSDRRALKADFDARHPRGPLDGLVSEGVVDQLLEDKFGQPTGVISVEYFSRKGKPFRPVAVRYNDGPLEWLQQQAPAPSPARRDRGYFIQRPRRHRGRA